MQESFFVQEEIARENILPIELLEEVAGRNGNFAKWLVRMLRFPFGEFFAGFGEILKIQGLKSGNEFRHVAERWTGSIGIRPSVADGRREEQQGRHAMASPTHLSFSSEKARQEARFAVHRRAIVRIGKEHALFGREALRQAEPRCAAAPSSGISAHQFSPRHGRPFPSDAAWRYATRPDVVTLRRKANREKQ